ncbi:hypothetical protein BDW42DRAFT_100791 [Aspergillus taichungensis]|uniref:Uncharacterized protein n=1 Tax=Aspergillus taichungensis TaxID=482145 RepID=A0A2J5HV00_9EURO|nr:hypothetical protein BDW42DRAFT_100791 [Aspergillus taichungensis]
MSTVKLSFTPCHHDPESSRHGLMSLPEVLFFLFFFLHFLFFFRVWFSIGVDVKHGVSGSDPPPLHDTGLISPVFSSSFSPRPPLTSHHDLRIR